MSFMQNNTNNKFKQFLTWMKVADYESTGKYEHFTYMT